MSEIGRQHCQPLLCVGVISIGIDQRADSEAMAKVVDAWPTRLRTRDGARPADQSLERPLNVAVQKPSTGWRDE